MEYFSCIPIWPVLLYAAFAHPFKYGAEKMSKICEICGKGPAAGRKITRRGLAKKKGGVGQKVTGISRRRFLPNLKSVRAIVDGRTRKLLVCVKCLKAGKVTKSV
jgi:large subunit ribosomal protein L28